MEFINHVSLYITQYGTTSLTEDDLEAIKNHFAAINEGNLIFSSLSPRGVTMESLDVLTIIKSLVQIDFSVLNNLPIENAFKLAGERYGYELLPVPLEESKFLVVSELNDFPSTPSPINNPIDEAVSVEPRIVVALTPDNLNTFLSPNPVGSPTGVSSDSSGIVLIEPINV